MKGRLLEIASFLVEAALGSPGELSKRVKIESVRYNLAHGFLCSGFLGCYKECFSAIGGRSFAEANILPYM